MKYTLLESYLTFRRLIVKYEFAGSKPVLFQKFSSHPLNLTLSELQKIAGGHVEARLLHACPPQAGPMLINF